MRLIGEPGKEFVPSSTPRSDVLRLGWDRPSVKRLWEQFLGREGDHMVAPC